MRKKTLIISAFPGCGKTHLFLNQAAYGYSIADSDSSKFPKIKDWEKTYVDHIEKYIGNVDFIMFCQYPEVLCELHNRNIPFVVVAPNNDETLLSDKERQLIKQQWFGRFILRDNSHIKDINSWIKELSTNYEKWTKYEYLMRYKPVSWFPLAEAQYLSDIIRDLYFKKETYEMYDAGNSIRGV